MNKWSNKDIDREFKVMIIRPSRQWSDLFQVIVCDSFGKTNRAKPDFQQYLEKVKDRHAAKKEGKMAAKAAEKEFKRQSKGVTQPKSQKSRKKV